MNLRHAFRVNHPQPLITHLADMTCCGPLAFSLHSWHFGLIKARRFVEAAISHGGACKARSATEQDGLRGWEESTGKSIHIRQQSKILEEYFVRFVCIPGGSGFVSWTGDFFVGQLVLCLKSPSKRTRWQIHRPQR